MMFKFARFSSHMHEMMRGTSIALLLKIAGTGFSLGYNILLARLLGANGVGIYFLSLTVIAIATVIGKVGLDPALLRYTATTADQNDWDQMAGLYKKSMSIATSGSLIAAFIIYVSANTIAVGIFKEPDLVQPLKIMILGVPFLSLFTLHGELLKGLKKIGKAFFVQSVALPLIGLPLLFGLGSTFDIAGAAMAYLSSTFLVLLISIGLWRGAAPEVRRRKGTFDLAVLWSTSLPLFWAALMTFALNWIDTIMLGILSDSVSVGIYSVALRVARLVNYILLAVSSIAAPKFAELHLRQDIAGFRQAAQGAVQLVSTLSLPLIILFLLIPQIVLGLFGSEFEAGVVPLRVLAIGFMIKATSGLVSQILIMTGNQNTVGQIMTATALISLGLNYLLITQYGMLGASIATVLATVFLSGSLAWCVHRKLGFWPTLFALSRR